MDNLLTIHCRSNEDPIALTPLSVFPLPAFRTIIEELPKVVVGASGDECHIRPDDLKIQFQEGSLVLNLLCSTALATSGLLGGFSAEITAILGGRPVGPKSVGRITSLGKIKSAMGLLGAESIMISSEYAHVREVEIAHVDFEALIPEQHWCESEKIVCGQVVDAGGATKTNLHIAIPGEKRCFVAEIDRNAIARLERNILYREVVARVVYRYCLETAEVKDARIADLLEINSTIDMVRLAEEESFANAFEGIDDLVAAIRDMRG